MRKLSMLFGTALTALAFAGCYATVTPGPRYMAPPPPEYTAAPQPVYVAPSAPEYTYFGPHPIPGGGWCWIQGEHYHPYVVAQGPDYTYYNHTYRYVGHERPPPRYERQPPPRAEPVYSPNTGAYPDNRDRGSYDRGDRDHRSYGNDGRDHRGEPVNSPNTGARPGDSGHGGGDYGHGSEPVSNGHGSQPSNGHSPPGNSDYSGGGNSNHGAGHGGSSGSHGGTGTVPAPANARGAAPQRPQEPHKSPTQGQQKKSGGEKSGSSAKGKHGDHH